MRTAPQGAVQVGCDGDGVGIVTCWQQLVHHSAGDQLDGGLGCIQGRVRSLKHDMAKGVEQERATFPLLVAKPFVRRDLLARSACLSVHAGLSVGTLEVAPEQFDPRPEDLLL